REKPLPDRPRAGAIRKADPVSSPFPTVAGYLVGAARPARRQDDRLGRKKMKAAALAIVSDDSGGLTAVEHQLDDGMFHVHRRAKVNGVILECPNQLESGPVADVRQPWVTMTAEVTLVDASVRRTIE